jgi:hypothetical protein
MGGNEIFIQNEKILLKEQDANYLLVLIHWFDHGCANLWTIIMYMYLWILYIYYPSVNCSSATSCAIRCNSLYSACTGSNTYGCCGSSCILACSSTYSLTCNVYNNKAYCSNAMSQYRIISMITIVSTFMTLYFGSQYFYI